MSDSKDLATLPETDITEKDMEKVEQFVVDGLPGIAAVNETKLYKMMDLYLGGSSYWQISSIMEVKRPLVLYLSHKYGWYPAKKEYTQEVERQLKARVVDAKLVSQDFLLQLIQMWQKKIGKQAAKLLSGEEGNPANQIDLKETAELRKTIELLLSLNSDGKTPSGKSPAVGLNVGDGVTIERHGDSRLTITPANKEAVIGDMLKKYADLKRSEEIESKTVKQRDIQNNKEDE